MPAYTGCGDPVPQQRKLDLPGYPGGYDLAGNRVNNQFQLDVFGEALLLFAAAARHDHLTVSSSARSTSPWPPSRTTATVPMRGSGS